MTLASATCDICGKVFSKKGHMERHLRTVHKVEMKVRKRGRPKKGEEEGGSSSSEVKRPRKEEKDLIELDEYMSTVGAEKENHSGHNDYEYDVKPAENTPEDATKRNLSGGEGAHGSLTCEICGKALSKKGHLDRHLKTVHQVELKVRKRGRPRKGEEDPSSSEEKSRNAIQKQRS